VGFVATAPVASGDELLAAYGHQVWTAAATYEAGEQAAELSSASVLVNREADIDMWQVASLDSACRCLGLTDWFGLSSWVQVASDKKYAKALLALAAGAAGRVLGVLRRGELILSIRV